MKSLYSCVELRADFAEVSDSYKCEFTNQEQDEAVVLSAQSFLLQLSVLLSVSPYRSPVCSSWP